MTDFEDLINKMAVLTEELEGISEEPVEITKEQKERAEEVNRTVNHDSIYLKNSWKDVLQLWQTQIREISEFMKELESGSWDSKGDPVKYFDGVVSLNKMSTKLGIMRSAVDTFHESRKEKGEIEDDIR